MGSTQKRCWRKEKDAHSSFFASVYLKNSKKYTQPWFLGVKKGANLVTTWFTPFTAEREGFEPPVPLSTTVFKTAAIDHSAISPKLPLGSASFQKRCKGTTLFLFSKLPNTFFAKNHHQTQKSFKLHTHKSEDYSYLCT